MFIGVTPHVRLASYNTIKTRKKCSSYSKGRKQQNFKDVHQGSDFYDVVQRLMKILRPMGSKGLRWRASD